MEVVMEREGGTKKIGVVRENAAHTLLKEVG